MKNTNLKQNRLSTRVRRSVIRGTQSIMHCLWRWVQENLKLPSIPWELCIQNVK